MDVMNKQFEGVDMQEFAKNLEMITTSSQPKIEVETTRK